MKALLQDDERFHHRSWIYEGVFPDCPLNDDLLEVLIRKKPNGAARVLRDTYTATKIEVALLTATIHIRAPFAKNSKRNSGIISVDSALLTSSSPINRGSHRLSQMYLRKEILSLASTTTVFLKV
jgi:hypothetical protein